MWLFQACDMTHLCVWHDSFVCETWLVHAQDLRVTSCTTKHAIACVTHDSFMRVTWLLRVCDMAPSCEWHDSFVCVTWLLHVWHDDNLYTVACERHSRCAFHTYTWDTSHTRQSHVMRMQADQTRAFVCVWRDSFMCVTWLIHVCDVTHSCVWRDSFMCVTYLSCRCVMCLIHLRDMPHSHVWRATFICVCRCATCKCVKCRKLATFIWVTCHFHTWTCHMPYLAYRIRACIIYVCIYIYTYTYIYICIHIYIYAYIYI